MDDTTVWVFNLLCGYWLYEKYENKAVKRYFMDVSRANFYAKLCMKLGAYEKRLWNYFKIMSSENLYFFTALILLLFYGGGNWKNIVLINRPFLPGLICLYVNVFSFRFLNWRKDFSRIYCCSQSDSGGFLVEKATDATSTCLCLTPTVKPLFSFLLVWHRPLLGFTHSFFSSF